MNNSPVFPTSTCFVRGAIATSPWKPIGSGTFSTVFLIHTADGVEARPLAIKVACMVAGAPAMLQREYALLRELNQHRARAGMIPEVYDFCTTSQEHSPLLVMEYIEGVCLGEWMLCHTLTLTELEHTTTHLLACLLWLNERQVLHNDLHPGNLMVRPDGSLVLLDFGLAERLAPSCGTATAHRIGIAAYVAPERSSQERVSVQADLYSVGALLNALLDSVEEYSTPSDVVAHLLLLEAWEQVIEAMRAEHPVVRADLVCMQWAVARLGRIHQHLPRTACSWWWHWTLPWHLWRGLSVIRQGQQKTRELKSDLRSRVASLTKTIHSGEMRREVSQ